MKKVNDKRKLLKYFIHDGSTLNCGQNSFGQSNLVFIFNINNNNIFLRSFMKNLFRSLIF